MTDLTFNGIALDAAVPQALVTKVSRGLVGAPRDAYQEVPGRAGAWLFPEQPGDRTIVVGIHLLGDTFADRRAAVIALADWADSPAAGPLVIGDEPDRYWTGKLTSGAEPDEWALAAELDLTFRVAPYAEALTVSTETFPFDAGNTPHVFTVPDGVPARPVVQIAAGTAIDGNWSINTAGGILIDAAPIPAGAAATVNGISYMVTTGLSTDPDCTGVFAAAAAAMAGVSGDFPALATGNNTVTVVSTGSGTATLTWRRRWRG